MDSASRDAPHSFELCPGEISARDRRKIDEFFDSIDEQTRRHLSASELRVLRLEDGCDVRRSAHLLRHLGVGCEACWRAFDESLDPRGGEEATSDPVVLALRSLALDETHGLRGPHRRAVELARQRPLGFAILALEELRETVLATGRDAPGLVHPVRLLLSDPQLEAHDPRAHRDLLARCQVYLSMAYQIDEDRESAGLALDAAEAHLARGTGDPELEGTVLLVRGNWLVAGRESRAAVDTLQRAAAALAAVRPVDCMVEVMLQLAYLVFDIARDPEWARETVENAIRVMNALPPETNPNLRLFLWHELAQIEMRLAHDMAAAHGHEPIFSMAARRLRESAWLYEWASDEILEQRRQMLAEIEGAGGTQQVH